MSILSTLVLPLTVVVLLLLLPRLLRKPAPNGLKYVPGPKGLPLIGNTLQLQPQPQRQFQGWAREYGPLFKIQMGWYDWIFVNDPGAIREIFDKQSAATSGRVPMPVVSDIVSDGKRFLLMNYSPKWRGLRAIVHKLLTPKMSDTFKPSQEFEGKQLVYDIYQDTLRGDGESFYMHVRRYTTSVVMTSTYGRRVPVWDCEDVHEIYGLMKDFSDAATPGAFIADVIPPLADIIPKPLQWWRARALQYQYRQTKIWMKYWTNLQNLISQGKAPECFVKQLVENEYKKQGIDELQAAYLAGSMIEAGSETTSSALNSVIKYLAAYPSSQAKADEELTRVIGDNRSPTFEDEADLPYIRAIVKEILRMRPVTNIGTPHLTTENITYKEYFIPKGTVVTINQYAAHYDNRYVQADDFNPDRYLKHPHKAGYYAAGADPYERDHFSFGAGRRVCPGMHLAENSLYITVAKILWAFEITPPLMAGGKPEKLDLSDDAYEDTANTLPKPYRISFKIRSEARKETLLREWEMARKNGYVLGSVRVNESGMVVE